MSRIDIIKILFSTISKNMVFFFNMYIGNKYDFLKNKYWL